MTIWNILNILLGSMLNPCIFIRRFVENCLNMNNINGAASPSQLFVVKIRIKILYVNTYKDLIFR